MGTTRHTYDMDYANSFDAVSLRVHYTYRGATDDHYDKLHGWTPGDGDEIEIVDLEQEVVLINGNRVWVKIEDRTDTICSHVMDMYEDDLRQNAFDERADEEGQASDRAYDEYRDRKWDNKVEDMK